MLFSSLQRAPLVVRLSIKFELNLTFRMLSCLRLKAKRRDRLDEIQNAKYFNGGKDRTYYHRETSFETVMDLVYR
jgi:hypothetical protein